MVHPQRPRALRHSGAELRDSTRIMIDPLELFERTCEVAEVYERWLEAQADLFLSLHWFSRTSLDLFRAFSGNQTIGSSPARQPRWQSLAPRQGRRKRHWPPAH